MLGAGDVLGVNSIERLHYLDAEASTVCEEHSELVHGMRLQHSLKLCKPDPLTVHKFNLSIIQSEIFCLGSP